LIALGNFLFHYRNVLFPVLYLFLFFPSPHVFGSNAAAAAAGLMVIMAGQGMRIATIGLRYIIRGGSKRCIHARDLVTDGMFAHCRNPLYAGNILILAGLGLIANSIVFLAFVLPFFLLAYYSIVRAEEDFLLAKFGDDYRDYMRDVNRWFPRFRGLSETIGSMSFNWRRVVIREYNATFIWMAGAVLLMLRNGYIQPDNSMFRELLPLFYAILAILTVMYGTVRYLKKSKRLRDI